MSALFLNVLSMSLTASYVIIFVMLTRFLLKKAPKVICYALWGVVAFRLIIPFSFESMLSLMPRNTNPILIPHDVIYQYSPKINTGIEVVDSFVNKPLPNPITGEGVNSLQVFIEMGAYIWIIGIIALLVYSFVSICTLSLCQAIVGNLFIFPIVRIYQCSNGLYLTLFTAFIPRSP